MTMQMSIIKSPGSLLPSSTGLQPLPPLSWTLCWHFQTSLGLLLQIVLKVILSGIQVQKVLSHKLFSLSCYWRSESPHIELSHSVEHLILGLEDLLFHRLPLSDHLQGVALAVGHEVDPGVDGLQVDAHLDVPDYDGVLARVQLLKHLLGLLSCDGPKNVKKSKTRSWKFQKCYSECFVASNRTFLIQFGPSEWKWGSCQVQINESNSCLGKPWLVQGGVPGECIEGEPGVIGELFKESVDCGRHLQSVPCQGIPVTTRYDLGERTSSQASKLR